MERIVRSAIIFAASFAATYAVHELVLHIMRRARGDERNAAD